MGKLRRSGHSALSDTASLRLRAAWLYHHHGLTQKDVAERLGVARGTVIRLLEEAQRRSEVRIWIDEGDAQCTRLAVELELALGLDEAVVVPQAPGRGSESDTGTGSGSGSATTIHSAIHSASAADSDSPIDRDGTSRAVGLALGKFLSEALTDRMTIGVGWGRTLTASLAGFRPPRLEGMKVLSLLGGTVHTDFASPVEFAWRLSSLLDARCYLYPAPVIVDSIATKQHLLDQCGLGRLHEMADTMDLAVVSVGDTGASTPSLGSQLVSPTELAELVAGGAVADVMCNFLDAQGRTVAHSINERVMSIGLEAVRAARHVLIAAGGAHRATAIAAAIRRIGCHTLVTDEGAARALLAAHRHG